jgi:hypothetical protein
MEEVIKEEPNILNNPILRRNQIIDYSILIHYSIIQLQVIITQLPIYSIIHYSIIQGGMKYTQVAEQIKMEAVIKEINFTTNILIQIFY